MKKCRGFTLVELLIVVAILAVLVGMLLPALTRAKDLAKDVVCRHNLHNIWTPLRFYAEDWDGWLPKVCEGSDGQFYWETWNQMLTQYGKNRNGWMPPKTYTSPEIFNCGSYQFEYTRRGCYGMNGRMAQDEQGEGRWCSNGHYMLAETIKPADMYLIGDTKRVPPYGHNYQFSRGSWWCTADFRHLEHANVLFHDRHVESMSDSEVQAEAWQYLPWWNREEYYR